MAKAVYVGVGSKARKMKKAYVGIGGTARKVKKMYIGDSSGKARLCYSAELEYGGTAAGLMENRVNPAAASVGNYLIFFGGRNESSYLTSTAVDAYNTSLTKVSITQLSLNGRDALGTASIGNYALFAGGYTDFINDLMTTGVAVYDKSLTYSHTRTNLSCSNYNGLGGVAGGSVGNYAVFAGGESRRNSDEKIFKQSNVTAYNASLTKVNISALSSVMSYMKSASVGKYVVFLGGVASCAYNDALTKTRLESHSASDRGVSFGNYALFNTGGTIYAYDTSLTRTTQSTLTYERSGCGGTSLKDYAIFAGGYDAGDYEAVVDFFDTSLTKTRGTNMAQARSLCAGGTVGDYALFAGGTTGRSSYVATVDVYTA